MRLIIAGSRELAERKAGNFERLRQAVMDACKEPPEEIISGGAKGPDSWGEEIAAEFGIPVKRFIPDWDKLGKGAGHIRNGDMAVYASEVAGSKLVVMWDGASRGTAQMVEVANTYGLDVVVVYPHATINGANVPPPTPYIFPQSYSSLSVFGTCPRQYQAKYVTKEVTFVQNPQAKWGDDAHNALERYVLTQGKKPLPGNMQMYTRMADWVLNRAARRGGRILAERQAAVNRQRQPVAYKDRSAWIRGKIDITILYSEEAETFDWKTGKVRNDARQLRLYDSFTFADYPDIQVVKSGYIWLEHEQVSPPEVIARAGAEAVWQDFDHQYAQLTDAYVRNNWQPKPSGLCRAYCDVLSCPHNGKNK